MCAVFGSSESQSSSGVSFSGWPHFFTLFAVPFVAPLCALSYVFHVLFVQNLMLPKLSQLSNDGGSFDKGRGDQVWLVDRTAWGKFIDAGVNLSLISLSRTHNKSEKYNHAKMYSIVCNRDCRWITSFSNERFKDSSWVFSFVTHAKESSRRIYAVLPKVVRSRSLAWDMILRISSHLRCFDEGSW